MDKKFGTVNINLDKLKESNIRTDENGVRYTTLLINVFNEPTQYNKDFVVSQDGPGKDNITLGWGKFYETKK